ncbi:MAG: hypothetical protein HYY04_02625 [Chloroflexi bacterium]|nr:hypothetical protein [Chloroflexota bacterium]
MSLAWSGDCASLTTPVTWQNVHATATVEHVIYQSDWLGTSRYDPAGKPSRNGTSDVTWTTPSGDSAQAFLWDRKGKLLAASSRISLGVFCNP